ncbi:MAG: hypothetical protein ACPL89_12740 [Roseiflexus castenholzii]
MRNKNPKPYGFGALLQRTGRMRLAQRLMLAFLMIQQARACSQDQWKATMLADLLPSGL